jgi:hypothetical protein
MRRPPARPLSRRTVRPRQPHRRGRIAFPPGWGACAPDGAPALSFLYSRGVIRVRGMVLGTTESVNNKKASGH